MDLFYVLWLAYDRYTTAIDILNSIRFIATTRNMVVVDLKVVMT